LDGKERACVCGHITERFAETRIGIKEAEDEVRSTAFQGFEKGSTAGGKSRRGGVRPSNEGRRKANAQQLGQNVFPW